jgi:hypothetical protein
MNLEKFFDTFLSILKPIKSVFGLYLLMYALPILIPLYMAFSIKDALVSNNGEMSLPVALVQGACAIAVFLWTIFFLLFFTKQRTNNPELSELTVGGVKNDKQ